MLGQTNEHTLQTLGFQAKEGSSHTFHTDELGLELKNTPLKDWIDFL
jgi:hypothetical protein